MNRLKKLLSVLLATVIIFVGLPITLNAEENEEYIFLSDIYYAYSSYISESEVLNTYSSETIEIMYVALENYLNDPSFDITSIKTALSTVNDMAEFIKLMMSGSSYFSNTIKQDAMETANHIFLQNLLNTYNVEGAGVSEEIADDILALCETFEEFTAYVTGKELKDAEILEKAMDFLVESDILSEVTSSHLSDILSSIIPNLKTASGIASIGGDMIKLGKVIMIATMLEDARLSIVGDILSCSTYGSTLYDGMKKLYNEIDGGFGAYIYDNYVTGGLFEKLGSAVLDKIVFSGLQDATALYNLVALVLQMSVDIVFPNVPDLNEIMLQMVLTDYANGMHGVLVKYDNIFEQSSFLSKDIKTHQNLTKALQVITDTALEKTLPLAVTEDDEKRLNHLIKKYSGNFDLYSSMMADIKNIIANIAPENRKVNYYEEWVVNENVSLVNASDVIEYNKLYCTNGVFNGNIKVWERNSLTVPKNEVVAVNGNLSLMFQTVLDNCGTLDIAGDLKKTYHDEMVYNDGILKVGGDLYVEGLAMTEETAAVYVKGNVNTNNYLIENGTLILNGEEQQFLSYVKAHNITVTNPKGIFYQSDIYVSGHYQLNGNPIDNNGSWYYTIINSNDVTFDNVSDFKNIRIVGERELPLKVKGNLNIYQDASLVIPEGETAIIDGDMTFSYDDSSILTNNGELTVTGVVSGNWAHGVLNNNGKIQVGGDLYIKQLNMSLDTAEIDIKGSVGFRYDSLSNITDGTVIFSGTEQQTLNNLRLDNVTVTNPNGIKYNSDIYVSGHYQLNGNPLDNDSYYTVINSNEATFDKDSDFKNIRITTEMEMPLDVKGDLYIKQDSALTIPEGKTVTVDGDIIFNSGNSTLTNNGELTVTGNVSGNWAHGVLNNNGKIQVGGDLYIKQLNMSLDTAEIDIKGSVGFQYDSLSNITGGTVIFSGTELQTLNNLRLDNVTVTNPNGIKYNSDIYVSGHYQLNGNPLDNGSYYTVINSNEVTFDKDSDFKNIRIITEMEMPLDVKGDLYIKQDSALTIPEGKTVTVDGDIIFDSNSSTLTNNGELIVTGNINVFARGILNNNGKITVKGNFSVKKIIMNKENTTLKVGGNINNSTGFDISAGSLILNGESEQSIYNLNTVPVIVLENKSQAGVVFKTSISPKLFIHNGNNYTLYEGGRGTIFADFDGDKVTDEKDDDPVVFSNKNYCETVCDVTANGKTDVIDFISIKKIISSDTYSKMADLNNDGSVNVTDMTVLKKVLLGIYSVELFG